MKGAPNIVVVAFIILNPLFILLNKAPILRNDRVE